MRALVAPRLRAPCLAVVAASTTRPRILRRSSARAGRAASVERSPSAACSGRSRRRRETCRRRPITGWRRRSCWTGALGRPASSSSSVRMCGPTAAASRGRGGGGRGATSAARSGLARLQAGSAATAAARGLAAAGSRRGGRTSSTCMVARLDEARRSGRVLSQATSEPDVRAQRRRKDCGAATFPQASTPVEAPRTAKLDGRGV